MATHLGIGFSKNPDALLAYKEAAIDAKQQNGQPYNNLVLILHTPEYLREGGFDIIEKLLQPMESLSAMTPGIILNNSVETRGVAVLAITSDEVRLSVASKEEISFFPLKESGLRFSQEITSSFPTSQRLALCLFLGSLTANNSLFIQGVNEGLGHAFPLFGGMSSDSTLTRSAISAKGKLLNDGVAGLLLGGHLSFAMSARHGWLPLGRPRIVTNAIGNCIREIDHQPAISIYQDYFPEEFAALEPGKLGTIGLLYPLGLNTDVPRQYLVRHAVNTQPDGSIVFQGDVPIGSRVHLMIGDKDSCRAAAQEAAMEVRERFQGKAPKLIIVFQSIARSKLFGRAITQEIALIKEILGLTANVFGMYTYGEIAPMTNAAGLAGANIQGCAISIAAIK